MSFRGETGGRHVWIILGDVFCLFFFMKNSLGGWVQWYAYEPCPEIKGIKGLGWMGLSWRADGGTREHIRLMSTT